MNSGGSDVLSSQDESSQHFVQQLLVSSSSGVPANGTGLNVSATSLAPFPSLHSPDAIPLAFNATGNTNAEVDANSSLTAIARLKTKKVFYTVH